MNQKTLIILASIILIALLAIWGYLMFFTSPENPGGVFANLGQDGQVDTSITTDGSDTSLTDPVVNLERPKLLQLTTRPVIGFTEVNKEGNTPALYYAEAGTGHIYSIDFGTGQETRLSNTTIPEASTAVFSPNGSHVALRAHNNKQADEIIIGTLNKADGSLNQKVIAEEVYDFTINDTDLLYTTRETSGLIARAYNLNTNTTKDLFTVPFFEATVAWGSTTKAEHLVFPKPASLLEGYLYSYQSGKRSRLPVSGFGFTSFNTDDHIFYTKLVNYKTKSFVYNKSNRDSVSSPIILLPEKCVTSSLDSSKSWCASEIRDLPTEFPDDWYRGALTFKDSLWQIDSNEYSFSELVNTHTESGREVDATNLSTGTSETALYFINKNDNTLWMYEL